MKGAGLRICLAVMPCIGQTLGSQQALHCPTEHGYARFVHVTFMDGSYHPVEHRAVLAWSALNLARLLAEERRDALDIKRSTSIRCGVPVGGEQDDDKNPWRCALTSFGGVLAQYSAATGSAEIQGLALRTFPEYAR